MARELRIPPAMEGQIREALAKRLGAEPAAVRFHGADAPAGATPAAELLGWAPTAPIFVTWEGADPPRRAPVRGAETME